MIKLITINSELKSAKKLGFPTIVPNDYIVESQHSPNDIIIRWGNSRNLWDDAIIRKREFRNVINHADKIRFNCQKHKSLAKLGDVVKVPKIYTRNVPDKLKVVVRNYEHTGGQDFVIKKGPFDLQSGQFAAEFYQTDIEYRVWFCGGKTFCARRVPLNKEDLKARPCRANWGYRYQRISESLKEQTLLAAEHLGLEVGAADILVYKGKYIFLELNTAPTIDTGRLITFFKKNLNLLLKNKFPEEMEKLAVEAK